MSDEKIKEQAIYKLGIRDGRKQIQEELIKILGLWDKFEPIEEKD